MKINIGSYINYKSPFKIVYNFLILFGFFEDEAESITDKFLDSRIGEYFVDFIIWLDQTKKRKIKIKIHDYDLWSVDHTLSLIIYEVLKKYRYSKRYGIPNDENTSFLLCGEDKELEKNLEQAWNDKLDKMIWSFEQIINEDDEADKFWKNEGTAKMYDFAAAKTHSIKVQEGLDLFAKFFRNLWD